MSATFRITIHESAGESRQLHFDPGTYEIGRELGCAVVLTGLDVSRRHARLTIGSADYVIEDLGRASETQSFLSTSAQRLGR